MMTWILKILFLVSFSVVANSAELPKSLSNSKEKSDWKVVGGLQIFQFDYKEKIPYNEILDVQLRSEEFATAFAPYVQLQRDLPRWGNSFFWSELVATSANSNFTGTTMTGAPSSSTNVQIFVRGEADLYVELQPQIFGYFGLSYQYWNRFLSGGTGYREIYTWWVFPVGLRFEKQISSKWHWAFDVSYRTMFGGEILIIFSETVVNGDDTLLTLGNRPGYKVQSPFEMKIDSNLGLVINPWYEYSEIGASNFKFNRTVKTPDSPEGSFIQEPASRTVQIGVTTGVTYQF